MKVLTTENQNKSDRTHYIGAIDLIIIDKNACIKNLKEFHWWRKCTRNLNRNKYWWWLLSFIITSVISVILSKGCGEQIVQPIIIHEQCDAYMMESE